MKRLAYILIVLSCITASITAQNNNTDNKRHVRWEEMKAKRAAFYNERIGMTPAEAQRFWPVYNSLQNQKDKIHFAMRNLRHNAMKRRNGQVSIDYRSINRAIVNSKLQEANLDKIYQQKFEKILPPEKLFRYYQAEREWAGELLKLIEKRGEK